METINPLDDLIRKAYDPKHAEIHSPGVSDIRARHLLLNRSPERPDIFSMLAYFLNLKIKLYHAVIAFLVIWITLLLIGNDRGSSAEEVSSPPYGGIAAVRNSTILSSCQTFVLKK